MIDGRGYGGRLKLEAMWNKGRPIDPQFVALAKFLFSYAYGTPSKHVIKEAQRPPVIFLNKPWDPDSPINREIDARSARMIVAKDAQLALEPADRKAAAEAIDVTPAKGEPQVDEGETLERVVPPPNDDPAAFR